MFTEKCLGHEFFISRYLPTLTSSWPEVSKCRTYQVWVSKTILQTIIYSFNCRTVDRRISGENMEKHDLFRIFLRVSPCYLGSGIVLCVCSRGPTERKYNTDIRWKFARTLSLSLAFYVLRQPPHRSKKEFLRILTRIRRMYGSPT